MKTISTELKVALATGCTTKAWLVKITRQDGVVLGFTAHDQPIVIGGITYESKTAFSPAKLESTLGMAADNSEILGVLDSDSITSDQLAGGLYDRARVDLMVCDWTMPEWGTLNMKRFFIGAITWADEKWTFSLMSLKDQLQQQVGRIVTPECSFKLGSPKCGVNLESFKRDCTVTAYEPFLLTVTGMTGLDANWARYGYAKCLTGRNAFAKLDIKESYGDIISLWNPTPFAIEVGTSVSIYPGCDKIISGSCLNTFHNTLNFGGFPQVPGADQAGAYAVQRDAKTG